MQIKRDFYLSKLKSKKENGFIKVITGIRRCGKSYLLFNLYHEYLNSIGVEDSQIIEIALDEVRNAKYRNPIELDNYIRSLIINKDKMYYVYLGNLIIHGYQNTGKIEGYVNVADKVLREYYSLSCKTKVIAAIEENGIREVLIMLEKSTKKYVEQFEKRAFAEKLSEMLKDKIGDFLFKK